MLRPVSDSIVGGMGVNMHRPFQDCQLDALSNFLSDGGNQPSHWQGRGPGTYFPEELTVPRRPIFSPEKLHEMIFQGVFILLTEMTSSSSGVLWPP